MGLRASLVSVQLIGKRGIEGRLEEKRKEQPVFPERSMLEKQTSSQTVRYLQVIYIYNRGESFIEFQARQKDRTRKRRDGSCVIDFI